MKADENSLSKFEQALQSVGVDAAIAVLNARVPHRYTGVFELAEERLVLRFVHDKQHKPQDGFLAIVPLQDSFCQIVLRDDGLRSDDTEKDARLKDSPYRGIIKAYHGVQMTSADGNHRGTLCHFDIASQELFDGEYQILREAAQMLTAVVLGRMGMR